MRPPLRVLLVAVGLFLVLIASFLPIFFNEVIARLGRSFGWLEFKHRYNSTNEYPKYFQEAQKGGVLRHYDGRFQHGILTDANRMDTQRHMMRAYLDFSQDLGLETWLAHGTLLGWWWNAKILPWDSDIDVQISLPSLNYLAAHYNQTIYDYSSSQISKINPPFPVPTKPVKRSYLLDINPAISSRSRDDGENVIDARWIDMRNGLYIDLTALSETQPSENPGVWTCKNEHQYRTRDLYPMRETLFEGVMTKVPYAYVRVLSEEYREKALVLTEYEGHRWNSSSKLWVKKAPEDMKQDQLNREEAQRVKLAEKARKKAAKEAAKATAKASKAKGGKDVMLDEALGNKAGNGSDESSEDSHIGPAIEKEPARRRRRAVVTEELVAELEAEEDLMKRAKRRRKAQDVL